MCTVTYLPQPNDNFILTSSRDISIQRLPATFPKTVDTSNGKIIFPKDGQAGGTWIGTSEIGRTVVLLNGGFENHIFSPSYTRSRGTIVRELLETKNAWSYLQNSVLTNIEPFTLLIIDTTSELALWEFVWDGERKYFKQLNKYQPLIYSSSTLYDDTMKMKRNQWFEDWLLQNPYYKSTDILNFHETAGEGNHNESIFLKRDNIQTASITSIQKQDNLATIFYYDTIMDRFHYSYFEYETQDEVALNIAL
ncbi:MAG: NRDE family protein [Saprospiraceae bacterium]